MVVRNRRELTDSHFLVGGGGVSEVEDKEGKKKKVPFCSLNLFHAFVNVQIQYLKVLVQPTPYNSLKNDFVFVFKRERYELFILQTMCNHTSLFQLCSIF